MKGALMALLSLRELKGPLVQAELMECPFLWEVAALFREPVGQAELIELVKCLLQGEALVLIL